MTQNQNQSSDKSNQTQQGDSIPQEVPATDTNKPAQQPATQSNQGGNELSNNKPADAGTNTDANGAGSQAE